MAAEAALGAAKAAGASPSEQLAAAAASASAAASGGDPRKASEEAAAAASQIAKETNLSLVARRELISACLLNFFSGFKILTKGSSFFRTFEIIDRVQMHYVLDAS